ncbi:MAG: redoxin domain-containing protein [Phycisphaerae bacterium]
MKRARLGKSVLAIATVAMLAATAFGQSDAKKLKIGDKAPPLTIEKWVKGEPVKEFEKGKVYVIEFWATWCGPCIAAMPHNTEIQKKYKDKGVRVIGLTSKDARGNSLEKVEKMVADKGDEKLGYTVAWDTERKTNEAYMAASGQGGIPCAFIVNQEGTLAWIGHPMEMDETLEQIVAGKYDMKAAGDQAAKEREAEEKQKAVREVAMKFQEAMQSEKWDEALKLADQLEAKDPSMADRIASARFRILLTEKKDYDAAYKVGAKLTDKAIADKDAEALNGVAWTIVDPEGGVEKKDLELAMKAATKADEFTKNEDGAIIDTLARVYFLKGDVKKAIELQRKAIEKATDNIKADLEKALKEYEAKAAKP